jgi:hypothetical protein
MEIYKTSPKRCRMREQIKSESCYVTYYVVLFHSGNQSTQTRILCSNFCSGTYLTLSGTVSLSLVQ